MPSRLSRSCVSHGGKVKRRHIMSRWDHVHTRRYMMVRCHQRLFCRLLRVLSCKLMALQSIGRYTALQASRTNIPCHAIPCHTLPCHTIPYHAVPYHTIRHSYLVIGVGDGYAPSSHFNRRVHLHTWKYDTYVCRIGLCVRVRVRVSCLVLTVTYVRWCGATCLYLNVR